MTPGSPLMSLRSYRSVYYQNNQFQKYLLQAEWWFEQYSWALFKVISLISIFRMMMLIMMVLAMWIVWIMMMIQIVSANVS